MARKAYGYVRVSTTEQADKGASIQAQTELIQAIAAVEGFELIAVYTEGGASGSIPLGQRPEGAKMLASAAKGDVIIVPKMDRAFRDTHDAELTYTALLKRGIGLYIRDVGGLIGDNGAAEFLFGIMARAAQFERRRMRERIAEARIVHKANGRFHGGATPFGYIKRTENPTAPKPTHYVDRDETIYSLVSKFKAQGYSNRLMVGALAAEGISVTRNALNKYISEQFATS